MWWVMHHELHHAHGVQSVACRQDSTSKPLVIPLYIICQIIRLSHCKHETVALSWTLKKSTHLSVWLQVFLSLSLPLSFSHTFSSFPSFSLSNELNPSISFFHASNHLATSPSIPPTLSTPPPSLSLLSVVSFGDELSVPSFLVAVYEK